MAGRLGLSGEPGKPRGDDNYTDSCKGVTSIFASNLRFPADWLRYECPRKTRTGRSKNRADVAEAINRDDAKAFAALFTEDANFVVITDKCLKDQDQSVDLMKGSAPDPGWHNGITVNREDVLHTAGVAVTNVRTSSFPVKASKSMCANVARPSRRASSKSVHGIRSLNYSRSLEVVATLAFLQHHFA